MTFIKQLHKWLSLIVGLQLLIWLSSGLYFNLMDHDKASGEQYLEHHHEKVAIDAPQLFDIQASLTHSLPIVSLKLITLLEQPYYLLSHKSALYKHLSQDYSLVNAYSGKLITIDKSMATQLARASYNGHGEINNTVKLLPPFDDIPREKNEVWQINYNDEVNTRIYIEAGSGRLIGHSNDDKRFADFFLMLHFMDYANEGGFNNIQIIIFAIFTLFLALSGFIWTIELGIKGHYKVSLFSKEKAVKLFDVNQNHLAEVILKDDTTILDALLTHGIALPSRCGGGGTCGACKVKLDRHTVTTAAEYHHFSAKELEQGYRLACQHQSKEIQQLTLLDDSQPDKHALQLMSSRFVSPYIKELRFKMLNGQCLSFRSGAYMRFFIPEAKGVSVPLNLPEYLKPHWHHIDHLEYQHLACTRCYSLAESSKVTDELVFTIKIQTAANNKVLPGVASSYLGNLAVGKVIEASGPFEDFFATEDHHKTMVLIGAGSGMAPLKSLISEQIALHHMNNENQDDSKEMNNREIHFFYGARTESDLLYADFFYQLAQSECNFHYYPTLSKPNENWDGATGYCQQTLVSQLSRLGELHLIEFYLCGPQTLMEETIELLITLGVKRSAIAFDSFK